MAAAVQQALGETVVLVPGGRGVFSLRVDGRQVAGKDLERGFPSEQACVEAVRRALRS